MSATPPLPPGFVLQDAPPLPPGFQVEQAGAPAAGAAPARGLTPPGQIPGQAPDQMPAPQSVRPAPMMRAPTMSEQVIGAVETGLSLLTSMTGGMVGLAGGAARGFVETGLRGQIGTEQGARNVEARAMGGMEALTYQPRTPAGQEMTEDVGSVFNSLPATLGMIGPVGGLQAGAVGAAQVAPTVLREAGAAARQSAPGQAIARAGAAVQQSAPVQAVGRAGAAVQQRVAGLLGPGEAAVPTPGTMASGGAAGTDVATLRAERAANLPVPIELTEGQRTRNFSDQRFERETAKDPEIGAPLRERFNEQNNRLIENLQALEDLTGAQAPDARAKGSLVSQAAAKRANEKKAAIRQAYDEAEAAGDMAEPVNYTPLRAYLEDATPTERDTLAPILRMVDEQLAKNDPDGTGQVSVQALEDIRKAINANAQPGTPNYAKRGDLMRLIDEATENAGGDLYKRARALYADYAAEFKNQGAVARLLANKKGTTDRKVVFEDVWDATILRGTPDDIMAVRKTLLAAGDEGKQAWREMQGQTAAYLRDEATKNTARTETGQPVVSAARLNQVVRALDADGRLELAFGKKGAQYVRDIDDIAKDVLVAPPNAVNTSNTASVLRMALDSMATFAATGGTVPAPALTVLKIARDRLRSRDTRKQIDKALAPDARVKVGERKPIDPDARPFDPEETPDPTQQPPGGGPRGGGSPPGPSAQAPLFPEAGAARPAASGRQQAAPVTKRERELARLRDETTDPEIRRELDADIAAERKTAADRRRGEEFARLAASTNDPDLKAKLQGKARELGAEEFEAPAAPGEAIELPDTPMTARAIADLQVNPADEAAWARLHQLGGTLDKDSAKLAARALRYDPAAVDRAAQQHERSPQRFERELQRIIDEGERRENETEQVAGGGARVERAAGQAPGRDAGVQGPARADGDAAAAADGRQSGGGAGSGGRGAADGAGDQQGAPRPVAPPARLKKIDEGAGLAEEGGVPRQAIDEAVNVLRQHEGPKPVTVPEKVRARIEFMLQPLIRRASAQNAAFGEKVSALADRLGADVKLAPVKGPKRAAEKLYTDELETGLEATPESIRDLVRASIVVKSEADVPRAIKAVGEAFDIVKIKDRFAKPMSTGYRDVLINVRLPDGMVGELQIHIPEMLAAKELGHLLYEIERVLPEGAERAGLQAVQARFYGAAYDASGLRPAGGQDSSSLSNSARPISSSSSGDRSTAPVTAERNPLPGDQTTGNPSRSNSLEPSSTGTRDSISGSSTSIFGEKGRGRESVATTERGTTVPVVYRVVDLQQLITSHDDNFKLNDAFPAELQPRDRSRQASVDQVNRMANGLRPEWLGESPKASDGAPIVGADGVVESGNARTMALRQAYATGNKADAYRAWLATNAERFGIKPADVAGLQRPVLIRQGLGTYDRRSFTKEANESTTAQMSAVEQAKVDAERLPDLQGLVTNENGTIDRAQSDDFIRAFMLEAGGSDRNALMTGDGALSATGELRLRNAVFAKAYGDDRLLKAVAESGDPAAKNILAGLLRAAPDVARVQDLAEAGARAAQPWVPEMAEAVRRFVDARERGASVDQYIAQIDMLGDAVPLPVVELMRRIEVDSRAPNRFAGFVRGLAQAANEDPRQPGFAMEPPARYAGKLADDLEQQQTFLADRARAAGFGGVDEWVAGDFEGFMRAADEWRRQNPANELREPTPMVDDATGLPLNDDGTVTLYHHTSKAAAKLIRSSGRLRASAEPDVYMTTRREPDTGYGDEAVAIRVDPAKLSIDDEFPDGRRDFRLSVGRPGGAVAVRVEESLLSTQTPAELRAKAEREAAADPQPLLDPDATRVIQFERILQRPSKRELATPYGRFAVGEYIVSLQDFPAGRAVVVNIVRESNGVRSIERAPVEMLESSAFPYLRNAAERVFRQSQIDPLLRSQTPAELKAKAEREAAALKLERAEQKRLADKAQADSMRDEFTLTGSDRDADQNAGQGSLFEPGAAGYSAPYEADLFGNPLPNAPGARGGRPRGLAAPAGDVRPAAAVPEPATALGEYGTVAQLVETRRQRLGHAGPIRTLQDAAAALAYLGDGAVERLDVLLTDKDGKPLSVVGGFKGAIAQAPVYPGTLLAEALNVPGAARAYIVHNHPSGVARLSDADTNMAQELKRAFDGTSIKIEAILAVGRKSGKLTWGGGHARDAFDGTGYFDLELRRSDRGPEVPVQERRIIEDDRVTANPVSGPSDLKAVAREALHRHAGRPVLILMDTQNHPTAFVPWPADLAIPLKDNGGLDRLLRSAARANASSAAIATGKTMTAEQAQNLSAGLAKMDVRVLDIIDGDGRSFVEKGEKLKATTLRSAAAGAAVAAGAAGLLGPGDDEDRPRTRRGAGLEL